MVLATQFYDTQRCRVQRPAREAQYGEPTQREVQSARTAIKSTATEEEDDFGYAFVTSGWTPSAEFQGTAQQPTNRRETSADSSRLAPKTLTMLVDSGASGHYFDDELQPGMKDKRLSNKLLERTHKMVIEGRQVLRQVLLATATGTVSGMIIGTESNKHQVNVDILSCLVWGITFPSHHNQLRPECPPSSTLVPVWSKFTTSCHYTS